MEVICDCQLSKNLKDYVWTYDNNEELNNDKDKIIINISPKLTFHWSGGLHFLDKLKKFYECCEGSFEFDKNIDIVNLMNSLGIEYSSDLYNIINGDLYDGISCKCDSCSKITKYKLEIIHENIRCSSGYKHLNIIISDIKFNFNSNKDINFLYNN